MIICSTPYRLSFFGGGTDYPTWFREHGGAVLSTTIDKYCYLTVRHLPPFFAHRHRIVYSRIENCSSVADIQHPAVRAALSYLRIDEGVEIHHDGDLPARSGIGSSSAFTVGLLHALHALQGRMISKHDLATQAIHVEQEILHETVGVQDQIASAYGGVNHITFRREGSFCVCPLTLPRTRLDELQAHLMLFFTRIERTASDIACGYVPTLASRTAPMGRIAGLVDESIAVLCGNGPIADFGHLMHEAWQRKRELCGVTSPTIDRCYADAQAGGALGGKITGAGGGGFMLLFVPPAAQEAVKNRLSGLLHVPFSFDYDGSRIVHYGEARKEAQ